MTRDELHEHMYELEKRALVGDRQAVIALVSIGRQVRAAAFEMLDKRYLDGECDAVAIHSFEVALDDAHETSLAMRDD